jgi:hypothetical protein
MASFLPEFADAIRFSALHVGVAGPDREGEVRSSSSGISLSQKAANAGVLSKDRLTFYEIR